MMLSETYEIYARSDSVDFALMSYENVRLKRNHSIKVSFLVTDSIVVCNGEIQRD